MSEPEKWRGDAPGWCLEHSYAQLPPLLHARAELHPVPTPRTVVFNTKLATELGLDPAVLGRAEGAAIFAGNEAPPGAEPRALAYAGHQFGHFTALGDGRALLLGEQMTPTGGRFDIQLKGSGPTPFSRRGDGRAALGPMLREYIISEAMHGLGIPTTRSLAVAATGAPVYRHEVLPGAVLTRVAASHIRVGTCEWVAAHQDTATLRSLADYTIWRHFPEVDSGGELRFAALLRGVMERQAALVAQWMHVGFIHGVMNTDNMALSGESIDYGPCAFMDAYDPATKFSSIDRQGRYAYGNQASIAQWNLARLAEALLPLLDANEEAAVEMANAAIDEFPMRFHAHWLAGMRRKLGLFNDEPGDEPLVAGLLAWMQTAGADFTNTFRALSADETGMGAVPSEWLAGWHARRGRQSASRSEQLALMRGSNPAVIPRNHLVEEALSAAVESDDLTVMHQLLHVLASPYDHGLNAARYHEPAVREGGVYETFCGT